MVTWDEIKVALHQTGLEQGVEQGEARKLVEFVALYWNEAAGQAFQARLAHREARSWPSLRALRAAYEAGRDPCALLDAVGRAHGRRRPLDPAAADRAGAGAGSRRG